MACLTIFPATFSSPTNPRGKSMIFYGDIAASPSNANSYDQRIFDISDEDFLSDLNKQIFTLSKIASDKFSKIQKITCILIAHFLLMAAFLIAGIIYFL
ncbi:hypothetical protein D9M69_697870 [compost metagenome]